AILAGLVLWGTGNHYLVALGLSTSPGISLIMGFIGAGAVMTTGVLLSRLNLARAIRYCGENSIVIYLAFFLFMAGTRTLLLRLGMVSDLGVVSLIVTAAGVAGSVVLVWSVRATPLAFLFNRPRWARLQPVLERRPTFAASYS